MPLHCTKCGGSNSGDAKYCAFCGAEIAQPVLGETDSSKEWQDASKAQPPAQPESPAVAPTVVTTQPVTTGPPVITTPTVITGPSVITTPSVITGPTVASTPPIWQQPSDTGEKPPDPTALTWPKAEWPEIKIEPIKIDPVAQPVATAPPADAWPAPATFPSAQYVEPAPTQEAPAEAQPVPAASGYIEPEPEPYRAPERPPARHLDDYAKQASPITAGEKIGCGCVTLFIPLVGIIAAIIWLTKKRPGAIGFLIYSIVAPVVVFTVAFIFLYSLGTDTQEKENKSAKEGLYSVQLLLERYAVDHNGFYPADVNELITGKYAEAFPANPWKDASGDAENAPMQPALEGSFSAGDFVYVPAPDDSGNITAYSLKLYGHYESDGFILELSNLPLSEGIAPDEVKPPDEGEAASGEGEASSGVTPLDEKKQEEIALKTVTRIKEAEHKSYAKYGVYKPLSELSEYGFGGEAYSDSRFSTDGIRYSVEVTTDGKKYVVVAHTQAGSTVMLTEKNGEDKVPAVTSPKKNEGDAAGGGDPLIEGAHA